jgi:regulator of sirC expression with transglutaminase-like and TPR domain
LKRITPDVKLKNMKDLNETELRSLVSLLDEEDLQSLDLVWQQILSVGAPILPYLEELRGKPNTELADKAEAVARQLRFRVLKADFLRFSVSPQPDLEKGALLLSRFSYPGIEPSVYSGWMDQIAEQIRSDLPSAAEPSLIFRRLNAFLFGALGFTGNQSHYYDPDNSFLHRVIESRRGIPVSLSVLYLLLARRLSLPVYGVGTPGHFLVAFQPRQQTLFLDAFNKGHLMDLSHVRQMLVRNGYEFRPEFVSPCPTREIIVRMMRHLISIYQKQGSTDRAEMISTLVEILLTRKPSRP